MEKIAFLFTGQGAQYVGMGKSLYDEYAVARQTYEEAAEVLGVDIAKLSFEGSIGELSQAENLQAALLTCSVAAFRSYMASVGIAPHFMAGHSLGEYAALTCAGGIPFKNALGILKLRGRLSQKMIDENIGSMTIVDGIPIERINEICQNYSSDQGMVQVNCYNGPLQGAIAGHPDAVEEVEGQLMDLDAQITPLMMSAPFHTPSMAEAAEELEAYLKTCPFYRLRYPVIANVNGRPYGGPEDIAGKLKAHMISPVRWDKIMDYLKRYGATVTIEMGPQGILSNLVEPYIPNTRSYCFGQRAERREAIAFLNEQKELVKHVPTVVSKCLAAAVATPNKNHDEAAYTAGVVKPYKSLQNIREQVINNGGTMEPSQMKESLILLKEIFKTKEVDETEQQEWLYEILEETGNPYFETAGIF